MGDAYFGLSEIERLAKEHSASVILLGDIFDEARPDVLSLQLFNDFCAECRNDERVRRVYVLQGNHDYVPPLSDAAAMAFAENPRCWSANTWSEWANGHSIGQRYLTDAAIGYALDYTPPAQLAARLQAIPNNVSILFCHQSWAEIQKVGHTDANVKMLPPHIKTVFAGDCHIHGHWVVAGVEFWSPGSTCMQRMNEDPDKYVFLFDASTGAVTSLPIRSRSFQRFTANNPAQLANVCEYLRRPTIPDLPPIINKPLIHVTYYDDIPGALDMIQAASAGERFHLETVKCRRDLEEIEVDTDVGADSFETLASAVAHLCQPGEQQLRDDAIRLLGAQDTKRVVGEIFTNFMSQRQGMARVP